MNILQFIIATSLMITIFIKLVAFSQKIYCLDDDLLKSVKIQLITTVDVVPIYLKIKKANFFCRSFYKQSKDYIEIVHFKGKRKIHVKFSGKLSN